VKLTKHQTQLGGAHGFVAGVALSIFPLPTLGIPHHFPALAFGVCGEGCATHVSHDDKPACDEHIARRNILGFVRKEASPWPWC
jgi:hypothetical protein